MRQNIDHTDRVVWASPLEALDANARELARMTGCAFEGPYDDGAAGCRHYVCDSAGLQVMAPLPGSSAPLARRLAGRGEGVFAVVFGVADLPSAVARLRRAAPELVIPAGREIGPIRGRDAGEVQGVAFVLAEVEYPDHLFPVAGRSPATVRNNDRLDHVAWICPPEVFDTVNARLAELSGRRLDGPIALPGGGIRLALSWEGGLEVISPLPGQDGGPARQANAVLADAEAANYVLFGVPDMALALQRAVAQGYTPGELIRGGANPGVPWAGKYEHFEEATIGTVMNTVLMYCTVEYPHGVFVTRKPETAAN